MTKLLFYQKSRLLFFMRITLANIFLSSMLITIGYAADVHGQEILDRKVTLDVTNKTVKDVLLEIEAKANVKFTYRPKLVKANKKVTLHVTEATISQVLNELFNAGISYEVIGDQIVLVPLSSEDVSEATTIELQNAIFVFSVAGKITDENGAGLPGVNIVEKNTSNGTTSDSDGKYVINVTDGNATLVFSFIGYATQEVAVGSQTTLDVKMTLDVQALSEVVVVGYGEQKRSDIVGSVASVNVENALKIPTTNISEMLRGSVPGVQVTLGSARPGGTSNILIRGVRSIQGGNSPLVILDGFPIENINDVNAEDIASVEILKDASAQAIYGARASNGVILITTKKGKSGGVKVSLHSFYTTQDLVKNFDLFTAQEFAQYRREARRTNNPINNGVAGAPGSTDAKGYFINDYDNFGGATSPEYLNYAAGNFANWEKAVLQSANSTSHTVTLNGGNDNTKIFSSFGYFKQSGLIPTSGYERGAFRLNIDQKINDRANISANLNLLTDNQDRESTNLDFITISPFTGPYDLNGNLVNNVAGANASSSTINPLWTIREADENSKTNLFNINVVASYKILKNLTYKINTLVSRKFTDDGSYRSRLHVEGVASNGRATVANSIRKEYLIENILNYTINLNENHSLDFTAVQSVNEIAFTKTRINGTNLPNDILGYDGIAGALNFTSDPNDPARSENQRRLLSFMGRARYSYKDKYLLTLTARQDGSSVFAKNNKTAFFPAIAVAWKLHQEDFINQISAINELKLRASYGSVGNQAINPYQTLGVVGTNNYIFGGVLYGGSIPGNTLPNPNLSWETSTTFDVGIDFGLLKNRITGSLDYYSTNTKDLLLTLPVSPLTGYTQSITNGGESKNSGLELGITGHIIKDNNMSWSVTTSFTSLNNEIVKTGLVDAEGKPRDDVNNNRFIGSPINVIYSHVFDGIFQTDDEAKNSPQGTRGGTVTPWQPVTTLTAGAIRLKDVNGDGVITLTDRVITRTAPNWFGSVSTNLRFRNFDFVADFYIVQGAVRSNAYFNGFNEGGYNTSVRNGIKRDYWTPENPSNTSPRPNFAASANNIGVLGIDDASYVRMRTLSIGYTIPATILAKAKMSSARIYATATNLLTITNYKSYSPENNPNDFPDTKGFTFGVVLGF
ncbi:MAG: TonB-dependent receptor [Cyclobacteriaceae bacterium]|nr:TonB-dependent receptor [Cyclobacteriaceae bacterium]